MPILRTDLKEGEVLKIVTPEGEAIISLERKKGRAARLRIETRDQRFVIDVPNKKPLAELDESPIEHPPPGVDAHADLVSV